jgi:hypothetical protein
VNCHHVFPDLRRLERKYAKELVVIGVHSAKFTNEKDPDNLRDAIARHRIEHPVVNDADFAIYKAYEIAGWPSFVLIDPEGYVAHVTSGEGRYDELDRAIAGLVKDYDATLDRKERTFTKEKPRTGVLAFPGKILATADRLYISDTNHDRIVVTDLSGKILREFGGFSQPQGLAIRGSKLFVADTEHHRIGEIDLDTGSTRTIAGTGRQVWRTKGSGPALETPLNSPWDVAVDGERLFIAMAGNHQIWVLENGRIAPFSGSGREDIIDGPHADAQFAQPSGLALASRVLYVADAEASGIREVDLDPKGSVRTIVGEGLFVFGDVDGAGAKVRLQHPLGVAWHEGRLYLADAYNHKIKVCDPAKREVRTLFPDAKFREPGGISAWGDRLYIADTNAHAIRVGDLKTGKVTTLEVR